MSARKPIARMDSPATTTAIATATSTPTAIATATSTPTAIATATSTLTATPTIDAIDDAPLKIAIAVVTEVTDTETEVSETEVSKTVHIENGDKTETLIETEEDSEEKTEQTTTIKEDNKTPDDGGDDQIETQESETETSTVVTLGTDAKRQTRNSPMLIGSPIKKKLNDSQEQDSSAESTSTVDECQKKNDKVPIARPKKTASSSPVPPPSNRLTRKTAAQDLAANTRLTRARRGSAGMGARPETPPKRKYAPKKNIDPPAPAVKRKRSVSPKLSGDEPEIKTNKPEESDVDFEISSVIVKQEALESSEEMISDVASDITEPFPPEPTTRISLRARKSATCYSPTTRAYRRDKDNKDKSNIEASISDAKRKRLSRVRPDEDSKDSLASSIMDEISDIKSEEKFESEDTSDITISPVIDAVSNGAMNKPLTVETELELPLVAEDTDTKLEVQIASTSEATSDKSNSSDKAASLSPDLVSEGISEISVKRFYKKPEFLENNLGIEKDPKLGEIVQNVADKIEDTADGLSVSNDSIKEGELVYEDEDDASIGSIKNDNDNDEDANSVSTGYISPLLVDEEEEDEEVHLSVNGDDEKCDDFKNTDEVHVAKDIELEADVLGEEAVEAPNEVPASNGLMGLKIDKVYENVKFETCDKTVGDIDEKDISTKEEDVKDVEPVEIAAVEMEKEKLEKQEVVEKMDVDELKSEKTKVEDAKKEKTETDQEENKENVELVPETVKDCAQEVTKTPEKERVTSISSNEQEDSPSDSSKTQGEISGDGSTPSTSPQSANSTSVSRTPENDDRLRQKERHFKTLGLLTHKAADEAIMAKQKRRKFLHNLNGGSKKNTSTSNAAASAGSAAGNAQNKSSHEYTGTLKTVIKLNRQSGGGSGVGGGNAAAGNGGASEAKRGKNNDGGTKSATSGYGSRRQSLKMTFQKGRGRPSNAEKSGEHPANVSGEDSYYTIQNETEGAAASTTDAANGATTTATTGTTTTTTHGRKSYNRSNTTNDATNHAEHSEAASTSKKDEKEEILIPEKASSFKFHPGRLCQDQCYYCSGKFGLYDTPCHVGQIKSVERQQKILANEEKLTVDNCLCDACFRHVDRRANAPAYKKRLSAPGHIETARTSSNRKETSNENDKSQQQETSQTANSNGNAQSAVHMCAVPGCDQKAPHSLRRKGIRKSIKKSVLNFDMSSIGTYLHLCEKHYEAVVQSSGCVLCKRRLGKNNMYHITTDTDRLEKALADMGIPVSLGQGTAVCKLCRYFANLLMKPPENGKVQKVEFVKNYKKRLLQFYNIHEKKDTSHEEEEEEHDDDKVKDKSPTKKHSIQSAGKRITRKSREPADECEEPMETTEAPPSPTPSSGSSVEMISDGGMFNADDSHQRTGSTPSSATAAELAANASNQMVLDNDVMVDYDVPTISDSSSSGSFKSTSPSPQRRKESRDQQSKLKAILQSVGTSLEDRSDISTVLRSNPNISMRELFPGEEDLGLQFKAPFGGSSAQRTPEGWTRINTFLQYDEPTRRLWEDLQKPYGNQSSFLRHLILLEKYYRNGDLILSSNASSNATVYTQTVRNRLTSYDSQSSASSSPTKELESRSRSLSVDKIQRQLSSNSVTITARPKESKSQQKNEENPQQKEGGCMTGASGGSVTKLTPNSRSILKTNLMGVKSGAIEIVPLSTSNSTSNSPQSSGSSTPNDSLLLTKQQKILAAANKLMSNKQETPSSQKKATLNTTPPELISLNRRPVSASSTQQIKRPQLLPKPMNSGKPIPPNVIVLPDTLTTQERLESKSWRPTLLPVTTTAHHLNNQQGPLYQTADGRRLPALVQVQSGGRPFLISIHDYNRMCILRREKLMRDQMLKGGKGKIKGIFPPATCTPSASVKASASNALQSFNKTMQAVSSAENTAKKQRLIMSKTAVLTPIAPKPPTQTTTSSSASAASTVTSTGAQQQPSQVQPTVILPAGTLQPISILSTSQTSALSPVPIFSGQVVPIINTSSTSTATASTTGIPTNSWLWNNFPDSNQMLMNGSTSTTKETQATTLTSMKQQHSLLMSKIPKSLTVIPQHKLMPAPNAGTSSVVGNTSKESAQL